MTINLTSRVPREGQVLRYPWWPIKDTALHNTVLSLGGAKAAWFLPVLSKDYNKSSSGGGLPIVLWPGTIVGILNGRDHTSVPSAFRAQSHSVLVPAHQHASGYNIVYSAYDLASDEFGGTYDLDESSSEVIVASTGATTTAVAKTRPLGVVQDAVVSQAYQRRHRNLKLQYDNINILSQGKVLRIPVITDEERDIRPGDRVMVSDGAGDYDPINSPVTSYPGRWKKVNESGAYSQEAFVMGRCVGRHRIVKQSSVTSDTLLLTDIQNANIDKTTLNEDEGYHTFNRVQTVPGVYLQGSGTMGVPSPLTFARADASGEFWAIDIALAVSGI